MIREKSIRKVKKTTEAKEYREELKNTSFSGKVFLE